MKMFAITCLASALSCFPISEAYAQALFQPYTGSNSAVCCTPNGTGVTSAVTLPDPPKTWHVIVRNDDGTIVYVSRNGTTSAGCFNTLLSPLFSDAPRRFECVDLAGVKP
jgi:hypothetical protein